MAHEDQPCSIMIWIVARVKEGSSDDLGIRYYEVIDHNPKLHEDWNQLSQDIQRESRRSGSDSQTSHRK